MKRYSIILLTLLVVNYVFSAPSAMQIERMQMKKQYLEAMEAATAMLSDNPESRWAIDFVHKHWDKTMRITNNRLAELTDPDDRQQSLERSYIYQMLNNINDNLRTVPMPLYGPNQKWAWQPEISYYEGHYNAEHKNAVKLFQDAMQQAVVQEDTIMIDQLKADSLRWRL